VVEEVDQEIPLPLPLLHMVVKQVVQVEAQAKPTTQQTWDILEQEIHLVLLLLLKERQEEVD
tara:strand:- start:242 stop:427 length:186 start_codon:yes stop_codon:yes gene_type:complete